MKNLQRKRLYDGSYTPDVVEAPRCEKAVLFVLFCLLRSQTAQYVVSRFRRFRKCA